MKSKKLLWIDCETTGLDPIINDIWELACIIEIDGKIEHEELYKIRPYNIENYSASALNIARITPEELEAFDYNVADAVFDLKEIWSRYIDKYDKNDKFVVGGYFVRFDIDFLRSTFQKAGDKYGIGSWMFTPLLEVSTLVAQHISKFGLRLSNYKLDSLCKHFNIELDPHQALNDIRATRELYYLLEDVR